MLKATHSESINKGIWSHEASVAMIDIMEGLLNDIENPLKKRTVFRTANERLKAMGFTGYTPIHCQQKWRNLVRTYRANKESTNKAKQGRFYFFDRMDEVYGKKPQPAIKHTLESNENEFDEVETDPITKQELHDPIVDEEDSVEETNKLHTITFIPEDDEQMEYTESNETETIIIEGTNKLSWSYEASTALIDIMENFLEDFGHPTKRKHIFTNINEHMISMGFASFTPLQCQHKWKSLVRTYRANKASTRKSAIRFHYFDKMDRLLGKKYEKAAQPVAKVDVVEKIETPVVSKEKECAMTTCVHEEAREKGKQKRHNERVALEKEKLLLERRKIALLEKVLAKMD